MEFSKERAAEIRKANLREVKRKKTAVIAFGVSGALVLCLLVVAAATIWSHSASAKYARAQVADVIDGDTISVIQNGLALKVRLNGIDCPEEGQAFGARAKSFVSEIVFKKVVRIDIKGHDRYGRTIADVYLPDGKCLNREIVASGYGWWFEKYSSDLSLRDLEQQAKHKKLGLWADPSPIPPWEYRNGNTTPSDAAPSSPPLNAEPVPPASTSESSDRINVKGYFRKDGTYVRPHTRSRPKR